MSGLICMKCGDDDAEKELTYKGMHYCRTCAHDLTHQGKLCHNEIACPVTDGNTGELIPYGTYPNIDWS